MMVGNVTRDQGRVWIPGVPDIPMTDHMRLRGMEILLSHRGERVTLDDLMVHSGEAFHLCHATKWETRASLSMPSNPWTNLADAYGYASCWTQPAWFFAMAGLSADERARRTQAFLDQIRASVDAGRPALLGGAYGECHLWRVVVGYDNDHGRICYAGGESAYDWTALVDKKVAEFGFWDMQVRGPIQPEVFGYGGWLANAAFLLGDRTTPRGDRERARSSLLLAVRMFRAPEYQTNAYGGVTYYFGEKAYEAAARDLDALEYSADAEKAGQRPTDAYDMATIGFQILSIVEGRAAAAGFCRHAAELWPAARAELLTAAKHYEAEAGIALASPGGLPWRITNGGLEEWLSDREKCKAGAVTFRRMLGEERAGIAQIEKALSSLQ